MSVAGACKYSISCARRTVRHRVQAILFALPRIMPAASIWPERFCQLPSILGMLPRIGSFDSAVARSRRSRNRATAINGRTGWGKPIAGANIGGYTLGILFRPIIQRATPWWSPSLTVAQPAPRRAAPAVPGREERRAARSVSEPPAVPTRRYLCTLRLPKSPVAPEPPGVE